MTQSTPSSLPSVEEAVAGIKAAANIVNSRLINREEVVEQAFYALLTGEHLLLQSRTGVGKTLLAEQIFSTFEGARIFKVQASKEQQPDTYFGGLDIEQLKAGLIFHNTHGSLVESEFGFIDEIFDANDFTLRALLSLLNERALVRGVQYKQASIHTVIAATNYLRISEVTEAVLDRFLYKSIILPDKNPYVQYRIAQQYLVHGGGTLAVTRKMSFATLQLLNGIITGRNPSHTITITPDVLYFSNLVIRHYEYIRNRSIREHNRTPQGSSGQDFYVSPRTQAKSLDLLRALALMNGRTTVLMEDVSRLYLIFTTLGMDDERQMFAKSYTTLVNTLSVSNGFDQLKVLLGFASLIEDLRLDPRLLEKPLSELQTSPIRRTLLDWVKNVFSSGDDQVDSNKKILENFLHEFIPVSDEIRELKQNLEKELKVVLRS